MSGFARWRDLLELLTRYWRTTLIIGILVTVAACVELWRYGPVVAIRGSAAYLLLLAVAKMAFLLIIEFRFRAARPPMLLSVLFIVGAMAAGLVLVYPIFGLARANP